MSIYVIIGILVGCSVLVVGAILLAVFLARKRNRPKIIPNGTTVLNGTPETKSRKKKLTIFGIVGTIALVGLGIWLISDLTGENFANSPQGVMERVVSGFNNGDWDRASSRMAMQPGDAGHAQNAAAQFGNVTNNLTRMSFSNFVLREDGSGTWASVTYRFELNVDGRTGVWYANDSRINFIRINGDWHIEFGAVSRAMARLQDGVNGLRS